MQEHRRTDPALPPDQPHLRRSEAGSRGEDAATTLSSAAGGAPLTVSSVAFTLVAVATTIALLRYMAEVFIPFVLAGLIFYALDPLVDRLQSWRVPRAIGAALALSVFLGLMGGLAYSLSDDIDRVSAGIPQATEKLRASIRALRRGDQSALDRLQQAATAIAETAQEATAEPPTPNTMKVQMAERATNAISATQALTISGQAIMILFLTYFLLLTDDLFKRKLVENIGPTLARKKVTVEILNQIASQIEGFLMVQVLTSVVVAVVTGLALWAIGIEQPAVWGLVAGVFNTVPYFGPLIVTIGLSFVGFIQFGTVPMALFVGAVALLITTIEGWVLTPLLMGRLAQMNTVAIFAGLIFWSWMWGLPGLLLAVPIMMVIKATCDRIEGLQPIGRLLGD